MTSQKVEQSVSISPAKFLALVHSLIGGSAGLTDPDNPLPHGPWDPVIRLALEKSILVHGPQPDPWRATIERVALNPQPLPPRTAFILSLGQAVLGRAELIQEISGTTGYAARFVDDYCGNGFRFPWPFPGPRPNWFREEVTAMDLAVMAVQFDAAAKASANREVQSSLAQASTKLLETGLSKLR